jgi:hypothetical protein
MFDLYYGIEFNWEQKKIVSNELFFRRFLRDLESHFYPWNVFHVNSLAMKSSTRDILVQNLITIHEDSSLLFITFERNHPYIYIYTQILSYNFAGFNNRAFYLNYVAIYLLSKRILLETKEGFIIEDYPTFSTYVSIENEDDILDFFCKEPKNKLGKDIIPYLRNPLQKMISSEDFKTSWKYSFPIR